MKRLSPSNHYCQVSIILRERPGISVITHFFHFLWRHSNIFTLLTPVYSYACTLTSLYQYDKKLTTHFPASIYLFKVRIVTLRFERCPARIPLTRLIQVGDSTSLRSSRWPLGRTWNSEWGYLFVSGPKLALGQPYGW